MKSKTPKKSKCGRVSRVSLSVLYNLGNYQNVKHEITAEISRGQSPTETYRNIVWILQHLKPIRPPQCKDAYEKALKKTAEEQTEWERSHAEEWANEMAAWSELKRLRTEALKGFDDLGGVSKFTDAKATWDEDDAPF